MDIDTSQYGSSVQQQPGGLSSSSSSHPTTITFHSILCDDDYNDDEALQESIDDIRGLAQQYGQVECAQACTTAGRDRGNVYIVYGNIHSAQRAQRELNGIVVGGSKITVSMMTTTTTHDDDGSQQQGSRAVSAVVLNNVLNDDDFDDDDCFNESIDDIKRLAQQYGIIGSVEAKTCGDDKGQVVVSYTEGHGVAQHAANELNGMVVGGLTISAMVVVSMMTTTEDNGNNDPTSTQHDQNNPTQKATKSEQPPPMYSGDKIVPERFAACKRVPKIPNPGTPRSYATKKINNEQAVPLLFEMLGELMRLQERSKDDKNARSRRRLVMGLREVARGIRAHKIKMVIMANNLDQYGAIDDKLQEILDACGEEDIPVVFELNKRKLGKALGKSIKVSVVGIQNADGAHEPFKKLKKLIGI